jgi:hypothetical protein
VHQGVAEESVIRGFVSIAHAVKRIRTVKTLSAPNGSFELTLTFAELDELQRSSLNKLLVPDNAVIIALDKGNPDSKLEAVMVGWICRVGEQTTLGDDGSVQRSVTVHGEDAGKFLARHELPGHLLSLFMWGEKEEAERIAKSLVLSGAPGQVLRQFFDSIFHGFVTAPQVVEKGIGLAVDPVLDDPSLSFAEQDGVWLCEGKFWNIFKGLADEPWNEIYADYDPLPGILGFNIVARPRPFDRDRWEGLRTTVVPDHELKFQHVFRTDEERVNLAMISPSGAIRGTGDVVMDAILFRTVLFDRDSAGRHGTQTMTRRTIYSDLGGTAHRDATQQELAAQGSGDIMRALRDRANKLWRWFSISHLLRKGVWVVQGDPKIRIGERVQNQLTPSDFFVEEEYERLVFYVENVIQDYSEESRTYLTHLAVTRGQPPAGGFIDAKNISFDGAGTQQAGTP